MSIKVNLEDNSDTVIAQVSANKKRALEALGIKSVNLIVKNMQSGYGKPIRQTGDLMRDVNYAVENSATDTVDVGNSLEYAPFVHEGTVKMSARHYIKDAINSGKDTLKAIVEKYLKQGF